MAGGLILSPPLEAGALVWVEFDPAFGHEQAGRRPALVVSPAAYNGVSSFVVVCPVTSRPTLWPFTVALTPQDDGRGSVLVDQIKSIDTRRVVSRRAGRVSDETLQSVKTMLATTLALAGEALG